MGSRVMKSVPFLVPVLLLFVAGCLLLNAERRTSLKIAPARMKSDFQSELRGRGIEKQFADYQKYVTGRVTATHASDKGRLPWIERLVSRPLDASMEAEQFTAQLYAISAGDHSIRQILEQISAKLPLKRQAPPAQKDQKMEATSEDPLTILSENIHLARGNVHRAFSNSLQI